jgi:DNA-binding NarL/FixJ family response regulator
VIRAMIVDDQRSMRFGLTALVETAPDIVACGVANCGERAVELAAEICPDVVVMDLSMPGMGGIEATRQIREACIEVKVLVLTSFADADLVRLAFAAGATGYVIKGDVDIDVLEAIRQVDQGHRCLSAAVRLSLTGLTGLGPYT